MAIRYICRYGRLHIPLLTGQDMMDMGKVVRRQIERLSRAVSLTVFELDLDRDLLVPAYLLANLMSPALWDWQARRSAYRSDGTLLSVKRRCNHLQRHFHRYTFTSWEDRPGGDPWGLLYFPDEARRLGEAYVQKLREEYRQTLTKLLEANPESQFGQILRQAYYREGYFPRLRNETIEVMDAYGRISADGRGSGKCAALANLWAAALMVWGRFDPEQVFLIGNRAHLFVFLDAEEGHLFNNTKWFSKTRIHNCSELSAFVRMVVTSTETTFFYSPSVGMCHCTLEKTDFPVEKLHALYGKINAFLSLPLKHPVPETLSFVRTSQPVPDPRMYRSAGQYQAVVFELARRFPGSVYDAAQYAFRRIAVPFPQAYVHAAARDYHAGRRARNVKTVREALDVVAGVAGRTSIFGSRDRIALPDETLIFHTGDDRDRALLLFTLLYRSPLRTGKMAIGFSEDRSYVYYDGRWIDVDTFAGASQRPRHLKLVFNHETAHFYG